MSAVTIKIESPDLDIQVTMRDEDIMVYPKGVNTADVEKLFDETVAKARRALHEEQK